MLDDEPLIVESLSRDLADRGSTVQGAGTTEEAEASIRATPPDAVVVDATATDSRVRLEVKVGPGDLGRVIGRRGRTAQSIRTVVRAAAVRDGAEVDVDFVD